MVNKTGRFLTFRMQMQSSVMCFIIISQRKIYLPNFPLNLLFVCTLVFVISFLLFSHIVFLNFVLTSFPECLLFLFSFSVVNLEGIQGYEFNPDYNIGTNLYALFAVIFQVIHLTSADSKCIDFYVWKFLHCISSQQATPRNFQECITVFHVYL